MLTDSLRSTLLEMILIIPAILIGFTFHEYAHAKTADALGDKTPKFQGRLTLNPIAHLDIIGFLMILIAHFGWAKPVQTNPLVYKNYYKDDLKVSFAGPLANLIVAFVFAIITGVYLRFVGFNSTVTGIIYEILENVVWINCMLFVFNLIPIPGLDGFHILRDLFPKVFYEIEGTLYRYQYIILILFVATRISSVVVGAPAGAIFNMFMNVAGMISG